MGSSESEWKSMYIEQIYEAYANPCQYSADFNDIGVPL
jgi:hypothetical protein